MISSCIDEHTLCRGINASTDAAHTELLTAVGGGPKIPGTLVTAAAKTRKPAGAKGRSKWTEGSPPYTNPTEAFMLDLGQITQFAVDEILDSMLLSETTDPKVLKDSAGVYYRASWTGWPIDIS